jgi:hypothetical protein
MVYIKMQIIQIRCLVILVFETLKRYNAVIFFDSISYAYATGNQATRENVTCKGV